MAFRSSTNPRTPAEPEVVDTSSPGGLTDAQAALQVREAIQEESSVFIRPEDRPSRDREEVERLQINAQLTGSEEDKLKAAQEFLRFSEFEQAVASQVEAEQLAQRTLFREQQAAARAGTELDLQADDLLRQQGLLTQNLKAATEQLDFGETKLAREAGSIRRKGALAARAGEQSAAQLANLAAQGGVGSSASRGLQASIGTQAATEAGDILTGLVDISANQGLLATQRETLGLESEAARAALGDAGTRLDLSRQELAGVQQDISDSERRLQSKLSTNLDFLRETFDLGGSITGAQQSIVNQQQADLRRAQERADILGGLTTGASLGSNFGPTGAIIGGGIGAVLSLF